MKLPGGRSKCCRAAALRVRQSFAFRCRQEIRVNENKHRNCPEKRAFTRRRRTAVTPERSRNAFDVPTADGLFFINRRYQLLTWHRCAGRYLLVGHVRYWFYTNARHDVYNTYIVRFVRRKRINIITKRLVPWYLTCLFPWLLLSRFFFLFFYRSAVWLARSAATDSARKDYKTIFTWWNLGNGGGKKKGK